MRNSLLITSDLKSLIVVDTSQDDQRFAVGRRGVLINVLGTDVCATEVPAEMDAFVTAATKNVAAFYSFEMADLTKRQLCVSYNETNNVVFIIGITDIVLGLTSPTEISRDKITAFAVKLKENPGTGFYSPKVILARLETTGTGAATKRFIRFYHLPVLL